MDETERVQKIHTLRFQFEKTMTRMSEIIYELNQLGCSAALKYEPHEDGNSGTISLESQIK